MGKIEENITCDFCNELNGEDNLYWKVAKNYYLPKNRKIYESKNWIIWPTIGAIVPGYVLIVSKIHRLSLMSCVREEIVELDHILKELRQILESIYGFPCIMFEHGSGSGSGNRPSCINHCHLHVLPFKEDVYNSIDTGKFKIIKLESLDELCKEERQKYPYLLYQNHKGQFFIMYANTYVSQYFRQLIAISKGLPDKWDWRHNYFVENINKTINDINSKFDRDSRSIN